MVRIHNSELDVDISALGAEWQSIRSADGAQWLWNGDAAYWTGRAPHLFPVVGKSPDNTVTIAGQSYPMQPHGFARRSTFELVEANDAACRFELKDSEETRKSFPFAFTLTISHRLDGRSLITDVTVRNHSDTKMPFGFGFHPAFVLPLPGAQGEDAVVELDADADAPALYRLDGSGLLADAALPTPFAGKTLTIDGALFVNDAMLFPDGVGDGITLRSANGKSGVRLDWQNLPDFAIWSKPGAGFVCLEPWHGTAPFGGADNAMEARPGATILEPGAEAFFSLRATFG